MLILIQSLIGHSNVTAAMLDILCILSHLFHLHNDPILQMKKLRIREVDMWLVSGRQGMNTGLPDPDQTLGPLMTASSYL